MLSWRSSSLSERGKLEGSMRLQVKRKEGRERGDPRVRRRRCSLPIPRSAAEREAMVTRNMGLVHMVAQKYCRADVLAWSEYEDLIQEGTRGLMRAAELYNPKFGVRFSTYAVHWIRQRIRRHVLPEQKVGKNFALFKSAARLVPSEDGTRLDAPAPPESAFDGERADSIDVLREALALLDPREARVIRSRFGIGRRRETLQKIADDKGIEVTLDCGVEAEPTQQQPD